MFHKIEPIQHIAVGLSSSIYGTKAFSEFIRLGLVKFQDTALLIPNKETYHHESMTIDKHGSIGGGLFEDYIIILDYINNYLHIKRPISSIQDSDVAIISR